MSHFFRGLANNHEGPTPLGLQLCQHLSGPQHAGDVNVMAAGMHNTHFLAGLVFSFNCAGVWQARPLFHRQGVKVGAQQDRWPGAVFQNGNDSVTGPGGVFILADFFCNGVTQRSELGGKETAAVFSS